MAAAVAVLAAAACAQAQQEGSVVEPARLERAVRAAEEYLAGRIGPDGKCRDEFPPDNPRFGGQTGLCIYALLTAQEDHRGATLQRGLNWLGKAKLTGTYAVAMRACAYAACKDRRVQPLLVEDVGWLVKAANSNGAYTYTSWQGQAGADYDNSNSQMALLGVWAGAGRGVEVPLAYWQSVERHWLSQQQEDGGWGYLTLPAANRTRTYGSMTAAGTASLYVCFDTLKREQFLRCTESTEYKPVAMGLDWLGRNFTARDNPGKGIEWYYYWLYCLERVGLASGYKYFGAHNWYAEGVAELLSLQNGDGSWGQGELASWQTAFALIFLVRGRDPVLISKLRYPGKWNARPRDLANLTRFISYTFERNVAWQVVGVDSPIADWQDAPILYLSGAGPCEMSDGQLDKLRTFVHQGGMIVSEAACNSGTFTLDMQKTYKALFPAYPLRRLPDNHPVYSIQFSPRDMTGLAGVSNGVRLLAIHSPRELSLALQMGPGETQKPWFELATNLYLFATDKGTLRARGTSLWPAAKQFTPAATIGVARVKYNGNYDPEPLAWKRLAILAGNRHGIKLDVTEPMEIAKLDAARWRVAVMTGTEDFTLSPEETAALRTYLLAGGTLIVDAAGGSRDFAAAVEKQLLTIVPAGLVRPVASHVACKGPEEIDQVVYRRDYAMALGKDRHEPRLRGLLIGERLAIIFSGDDLTGGLCGYPAYNLRGYSSETSVAVMTNLVCHAAGTPPAAPPPQPPKPTAN